MALEALKEVGPDEECFRVVLDGMTDPDPHRKYAAAKAIMTLSSAMPPGVAWRNEAKARLKALLRDPDIHARKSARWTLRTLETQE